MNSKETQELAKLLAKLPGIRSIELDDVRSMAELLHEFPEIGSIEVRGWFESAVVITRTGMPVGGAVPVPPPVVYAPGLVMGAPSGAPAPAVAPAASALKEIKSPMVGTFYRAPAPGATSFVEMNADVDVGQTVCIIEAMKLMNEIQSEARGRIARILVENGQPVEYGQTLFLVEPY